MTFTPTLEQERIIEAARDTGENLMISAYAGCAKTTTLVLVANALPKEQAGLALAFNVKIKQELEKKFPSQFQVLTLNGLGHRAFGSAIGKRLIVDGNKLGGLVTKAFRETKRPGNGEDWSVVRGMVTKAMLSGLVPKKYALYKGLVPDTDDMWQYCADFEVADDIVYLARKVLTESIDMSFAGTVSYDDQIYMSTMFGGQFPRFPLVMVDEAQDLSPLNHIQVQRASAGRLIVVGDPKQAIYAFRGADSSSMEKLRKLRTQWTDLTLATTFRCPKVAVARQQDHAPGFTAAMGNAEGLVLHLAKDLDAKWTWPDVVRNTTDDLSILCRNNAPLLSMAFKLIRMRIGCYMLGRDIGKGLVALSRKVTKDDNTPIAQVQVDIIKWAEHEMSIAQLNEDVNKMDSIMDKRECLLAVMEAPGIRDAKALRDALADLFSRESGTVTLSTGHRAKGLEWGTVLHLDPWRVPSRYALTPGAIEQEKNLRYVIETRYKQTLLLASISQFDGAI